MHKHNKLTNQLAKNILRGVSSSLDCRFDIENALRKIQNKTGDYNAKQALILLRTSQVYSQNVLTRHFNQKVPRKLVNLVNFNVQDILQVVECNDIKLEKCLLIIFRLYNHILNKEFSEAMNCFVSLIEENGVSLVFYRLIMFLNNRLEYIPGGNTFTNVIDEILAKIQVGNLREINDGVRQIINDRADYFSICSKVKDAEIDDNNKRILLSFISHAPIDEEDFVKNLNAHLSYSLLDAVLYLNLIKRMEFPVLDFGLPAKLQCHLDEIAKLDVNLSYYDGESDEGMDLSFYREAFLLIELDDCLKYKSIHAPYFNLPSSTIRVKTPYEFRVISEYFCDVNKISDLRTTDTEKFSISLSKFDKRVSTLFENTSAFDYLLNKHDGNLITCSDDETIFIKVMSRTRDIAYLCLPEYIETIKDSCPNLEVKLIALCLLTASSLGDDDDADFELRKVFQNLCNQKYEGKILEALKSFYQVSPAITDYFLMSFDEVFISRLFNINVKPNQALSIRAELFDWYGDISGEKKYNDRAKNTRIDIQINKHRQHIDDSRIYAEPARVMQWITDNVNNQLALQFDNIDKLANPKLQLDWYNLRTSLNPENSVGIVIANSYNEFVNNKIYGISSYLGRRIRHGTAKGTGVGEVKALSQNPEFAPLFLENYFCEEWNKWLSTYMASFDELIGEYFHIRSDKKKKGLLSPHIDNDEKSTIANALVSNLYKSYLEIDNVVQAPVLITEYCWRLIDGDLARARQHILKVKSNVSVFNIKEQQRVNHKRLIQKFSEAVNALTSEKFAIVCSWFNKPSYATQSADISLLFKVVIDEIKKQNSSFEPVVEDENTLQMLTGGHYFVIYDALTIIIKNIAEHGKQDGVINLRYTIEKPFAEVSKKSLHISISSESNSYSSYLKSKERIRDSLSSSNIVDAHVIEGDSGIKKLKNMEDDKLIQKLDFSFNDKSSNPLINAIFTIELDY